MHRSAQRNTREPRQPSQPVDRVSRPRQTVAPASRRLPRRHRARPPARYPILRPVQESASTRESPLAAQSPFLLKAAPARKAQATRPRAQFHRSAEIQETLKSSPAQSTPSADQSRQKSTLRSRYERDAIQK